MIRFAAHRSRLQPGLFSMFRAHVGCSAPSVVAPDEVVHAGAHAVGFGEVEHGVEVCRW